MPAEGLPVQSPDLVGAADTLAPDLSARSDEIERARRLPADIAATFAKAGFFRMVLPRDVGGFETPARTIVEVIERLAMADASAAWCVMIGSTTGLNAAYMDHDTASQIYGAPEIITGGVFAPMGKAVVEGDHYRVTGRWQWASGSANCSWLCGGAVIFDGEEMCRGPGGAPETRMMVFPASDAELIDTWHVAGLSGTGSGDMAVSDIKVPKARSVSLTADRPRPAGPLYAFPAFGLLALGVRAVAAGNARGALNEIITLATQKTRQGSRRTLAENQTVQRDLAQLEASLGAARAYLMDEVDKTWHMAKADGTISLDRRAHLRLACTHMTRTAADVCRSAYDIGGGAALFLTSPLQRRLRDAHAMTQHIVTAPATYEQVGRILCDIPGESGMI